MSINLISQHKCFDGMQYVYAHHSLATNSTMRFALFLPPQASLHAVPALYWLSGLTCTEDNFTVKAGAQRVAAELGLALIVPDTSPRDLNLPGEKDHYDFGAGASFYLDATRAPWSLHYQMYTYISQELPAVIAKHFPIDTKRVGLFGHSMGGHGALSIALRNPSHYQSVSAFAPICSSIQSPWGQKALKGYLDNESTWLDYDVTALIKKYGWSKPILVDQGTQDAFLLDQLKPHLLQAACHDAGVQLNLRMQAGYDHSYFFIATFIADHLHFHAHYLGLKS